MCAVSAVSDYYMKIPNVLGPNTWPPQPKDMDDETKKMLREVIRRLDEIDKRLGDRECMDDKKQEFLKAIGYVDNKDDI